MANLLIPFRISTQLILDRTIKNDDISESANIDRSKMNESQNLRVRSGKLFEIYNVDNSKYLRMYSNNTDSYVVGVTLNLFLGSSTGIVKMGYSEVDTEHRIYDSTLAKYVSIKQTSTKTTISNNVGDIEFSPTGNINCGTKQLTVGSLAGSVLGQIMVYSLMGV